MRQWMMVAALLSAGPAVAQNTTGVPVEAPDETAERLAVELASLFAPEGLIRQAAYKGSDVAIDALFASEPDFAAFERRSPGLLAEIKDALRPIIVEGSAGDLPSYWAFLAPAYRSSMTSAQMREAIAFYRSDVGQRYLVRSAENVDMGAFVRGRDGDWDSPLTTADVSRAVEPGDAAAVASRTQADAAAFERFNASPAGLALSDALPNVEALGDEWLNRPDPALDEKFEAVMQEVVSRRFPDGL